MFRFSIATIFAASALLTGGAAAQTTFQTYTGGTSGKAGGFASSMTQGNLLIPGSSHLQLLVGDPNDSTNGVDAGAIHILANPSATSIYFSKYGAQAGALYGFSVWEIGDQDGDGFDEYAVGAPKQNSNGADSGSVFIYDGKTGAQIKKLDGSNAGDQFGYAVSSVGDANLDGVEDYAVGSPFNDVAGADAGMVTLYSGATNLLFRFHFGLAAGDHFGMAIVGNFNDGILASPDYMIGAPDHNANGKSNCGNARVYNGSDGSFLWGHDGNFTGQRYGASMALLPNASPSPKLVIGAPGSNSQATNGGSVYLRMASDGSLVYVLENPQAGENFGAAVSDGGVEGAYPSLQQYFLAGAPGAGNGAGRVSRINASSFATVYTANGDEPGDRLGASVQVWEYLPNGSGVYSSNVAYGAPGASKLYVDDQLFKGNLIGNAFGSAVARGGDVNNDGEPDVVIGSPAANGAGVQGAGRVDVLSKTGAHVRTFYGDETNAKFGAAVGGLVDVDNDGWTDVLVGAPHHSNGANADAGAVYVYSGKTGALVRTHLGSAAGFQLGTCVCGAGDLDGDGYGDYVLGVPNANFNGANSGRVRVYSGQTGNLLYTWDGDAAGDHFGTDVARIGDINNDGVDEIAVGAPDHAYGGITPSTGFVRVFSGMTGAILFTLHGSATSQLGLSVASARDVDGDGVIDVIAGALNQGTGFQLVDRGAFVVYSGASGNTIYVKGGGAAYQNLGISVAGLGDINKDGFGEFAAGSLENAQLFLGAGSVRVYDGTNGFMMFEIDGNNLGDQLGAAISPAGDFDSDGVLELLVGGPGIDVGGTGGAGRAKVYGFAPDGLATYGQATPGCNGDEVMYGKTTPSVGNGNFRFTTIHSAPSSLSLGLVTDLKLLAPYDIFGLGFLMNVGIFGAIEVYTFDIYTDSLGRGSVAAPIPNSPWLAGKTYYGQVISYWGAGPCVPGTIGLSSSLGLEIQIQ